MHLFGRIGECFKQRWEGAIIHSKNLLYENEFDVQ